MITNKEKEMWDKIREVENQDIIKIKDWDIIKNKIAEAIFRKQSQIDEVKQSRDGWSMENSRLKKRIKELENKIINGRRNKVPCKCGGMKGESSKKCRECMKKRNKGQLSKSLK